MMMHAIRKIFYPIALLALIACLLFLVCLGVTGNDEGYFDRWDLNYFLYESDRIVEEAWCHEMMDDEFDRALLQYYSDEPIEVVPTINLFAGNQAEKELVTSILSFSNGYYGYLDNDNNIVSIPLSEELNDWWTNYGDSGDDKYRRPVPNVEFDGTQFKMVTAAVPANATQEELAQVNDEDVMTVNEDIVYEFLMRTYGIRKEMVDKIILEYTYEVRYSDAYGSEVPVAVTYLWFTTTDGTVSKLNANNQNSSIIDSEYYIVLSDSGTAVTPRDMYPWHIDEAA